MTLNNGLSTHQAFLTERILVLFMCLGRMLTCLFPQLTIHINADRTLQNTLPVIAIIKKLKRLLALFLLGFLHGAKAVRLATGPLLLQLE